MLGALTIVVTTSCFGMAAMESGRFGRTLCFGRLVQAIVNSWCLSFPSHHFTEVAKRNVANCLCFGTCPYPKCSNVASLVLWCSSALSWYGNSYGQVLCRVVDPPPGFVQPEVITSLLPWRPRGMSLAYEPHGSHKQCFYPAWERCLVKPHISLLHRHHGCGIRLLRQLGLMCPLRRTAHAKRAPLRIRPSYV